jgi:hypothetical protein
VSDQNGVPPAFDTSSSGKTRSLADRLSCLPQDDAPPRNNQQEAVINANFQGLAAAQATLTEIKEVAWLGV